MSQTFYLDGLKEFDKANFSIAAKLFSSAINNHEQLAKSYMMRGAAFCELKRYTNALVDIDSSIIINPNDYEAYYYKGRTYLIYGFTSVAIENFNKSIAINSKDSKSYNARATAKMVTNDSLGALKDVDYAIKLDSLNFLFYINRGFIKSKMLQYKNAIIDFDSSLKIKESRAAYADRGFALFKLNQYDKAIEDFNKSIFYNPNDKEILYYRGLCYIAINKKMEACNDFFESFKLGNKEAELESKKNCINKQ